MKKIVQFAIDSASGTVLALKDDGRLYYWAVGDGSEDSWWVPIEEMPDESATPTRATRGRRATRTPKQAGRLRAKPST